MKYCLIALVLLTGFSRSSAQQKLLTVTQIQQHVAAGIQENYRPDTTELQKNCFVQCIFIKFKVNSSGHIDGLAFNTDSSKFITDALSRAVNTLQQDKQLMRTLKRTGRTIIQPLVFEYTLGCRFPHPDWQKIKGEEARQAMGAF